MINYTDKEVHEMYLDWLNNFLSTEKFAEHYNLSMTEVENVLDRGRKIQELINKQIEMEKKHRTKKANWKIYRDEVTHTLRTIAKWIEDPKTPDYHDEDLDMLLDEAKHNYKIYKKEKHGE